MQDLKPNKTTPKHESGLHGHLGWREVPVKLWGWGAVPSPDLHVKWNLPRWTGWAWRARVQERNWGLWQQREATVTNGRETPPYAGGLHVACRREEFYSWNWIERLSNQPSYGVPLGPCDIASLCAGTRGPWNWGHDLCRRMSWSGQIVVSLSESLCLVFCWPSKSSHLRSIRRSDTVNSEDYSTDWEKQTAEVWLLMRLQNVLRVDREPTGSRCISDERQGVALLMGTKLGVFLPIAHPGKDLILCLGRKVSFQKNWICPK